MKPGAYRFQAHLPGTTKVMSGLKTSPGPVSCARFSNPASCFQIHIHRLASYTYLRKDASLCYDWSCATLFI